VHSFESAELLWRLPVRLCGGLRLETAQHWLEHVEAGTVKARARRGEAVNAVGTAANARGGAVWL